LSAYKILATVGFLLIAAGWTQRRDRKRHVPLVLAGMGVDLSLVAVLEFTRDVIGLTFSGRYAPIEIVHIATSAAAVVLYLPVLWFGFRLLRNLGDARLRKLHAAFAVSALTLRTIGFVCMFWVRSR
jgi:uncharacterized membrane protein YozB (DUF420 family)